MKKKPAAIKVYDFTKGGRDIVDERVDSYTAAVKSPKWTLKKFCFKLDVTRVNALSSVSIQD